MLIKKESISRKALTPNSTSDISNNTLSTSLTKWSNKLKQWQQPTNCFCLFDHFVWLVRKGVSLLHLNRCIQRCFQDPVKCLKWSFL